MQIKIIKANHKHSDDMFTNHSNMYYAVVTGYIPCDERMKDDNIIHELEQLDAEFKNYRVDERL